MIVFSLVVAVLLGAIFLPRLWVKWEILLRAFTLFMGARLSFFSLRTEEILCNDFIVDGVGFFLTLLRVFITGLMVTGRYSSVVHPRKGRRGFLLLMVSMIVILCFTFLESRIVYFFVLFERVLMPIFLMIAG
jgi:NADH:ubiquinone oxidoreductase subunit 2 (subunit N)